MPDISPITVKAQVNAPIDDVWRFWNEPDHITKWNSASDDWHTPRATSDLREGGTFTARMEAKDGSVGFDFGGTYTNVAAPNGLAYVMSDGRTVSVSFEERDGGTFVSETFDPESENSPEMQRQGWQSILDNFKKYAEGRQA